MKLSFRTGVDGWRLTERFRSESSQTRALPTPRPQARTLSRTVARACANGMISRLPTRELAGPAVTDRRPAFYRAVMKTPEPLS
ncbi:hypothetical protein GCM10010517_16800 [Streptosporangium fragile]|uniref:Uncharacterized protein n=1 Tax=Streptosporangium fragile TaxID=46186 RepID=A0ABN3VTK3_9ACTN